MTQAADGFIHLKVSKRQLRRLVDIAKALCSEAESLSDDQPLFQEITKLKPLDIRTGISFYDEVHRFETDVIRKALSETGGNQTQAAKLLGIKTTTLNAKIKVLKIDVHPARIGHRTSFEES